MPLDDVRVSEDARGGVSISRGRTMSYRPTGQEAIRACCAIGVNDPLVIGSDQQVSFEASGVTRQAVLEALSPNDELVELLDEQFESDMTGDPRVNPVHSVGNRIDGDPWAWTRGLDAWHLVPDSEGTRIAFISAWMAESMTGMIIEVGIRRWDEVVAVAWRADDVDGMQWCPVIYGVPDWDALLLEGASSVFEEPECPDDDSGWQITVDLDHGVFSDSAIGHMLGMIWRPCDEHAPNAALTQVAGRDWEWSEGGWTSTKHDVEPR